MAEKRRKVMPAGRDRKTPRQPWPQHSDPLKNAGPLQGQGWGESPLMKLELPVPEGVAQPVGEQWQRAGEGHNHAQTQTDGQPSKAV